MKVVRVGDTHAGICDHGQECCPHNVTGVFIDGSPDSFCNDEKIIRIGDPLIHDCPHCGTGEADEGSLISFANGIGIHRLGERVIYPGGEGVSTSASDDTFAG